PSEFNRGHWNRGSHLEIICSRGPPLLRPRVRRSAGEPAPVHLRLIGASPGVSTAHRLVTPEFEPPGETSSRCVVVPRLPPASLRTARPLDSPATLGHRLRRPSLDAAT